VKNWWQKKERTDENAVNGARRSADQHDSRMAVCWFKLIIRHELNTVDLQAVWCGDSIVT
jgi:hypothetical protein